MSSKNPFSGKSPELKACAGFLQRAARRHGAHEVFADFCEMSALSISNSVDLRQRGAREARYMAIVKRYQPEEVVQFPMMLATVVSALQAEPRDVMGELFMGLDMGNHWRGQFFTPYALSVMMAELSMDGVTSETIAAKGGFITVSEPACGSGGMIIGVTEVLKAAGINYQRHMHATLQDVDSTAVHMAYIQASLMGIPAVVIQGNTLTNEASAYWYTPAHILGGWSRKLARRANAEKIEADGQPLEPPPAPPLAEPELCLSPTVPATAKSEGIGVWKNAQTVITQWDRSCPSVECHTKTWRAPQLKSRPRVVSLQTDSFWQGSGAARQRSIAI